MDTIAPQPEQAEHEFVNSGVTVVKPGDATVASLKGYFGIIEPDSKEREMLNKIYELVASDATEMIEVLLYLKQIENKIGMVPLGKTRLEHVYQYISVLGSIHKMNKVKEQYER